MTGQLIGLLLAIYFLIGRWSMGRLEGLSDQAPIIEQPRVWIVALLSAATVLVWPRRTRATLAGRATSVDFTLCLFLGYMTLAALWAPNADLAAEKAFELSLLLVVAIALAASRVVLADDDIQQGFWWGVVLGGAAMASLAIFNSTSGRIHVPGGGPNTFGRNMGLMALAATYFAIKYGAKAMPICVAAMIVATFSILMCGSRGALLSLAVGVLALMITARASLPKKIAIAGVTALAGIVVLFNTILGESALDVFYSRILDTTIHNHHLAARDDLWLDAIDWTVERPWFGWGLNGYSAFHGTYPHNMFLEVAVEGGGVGLLLLLLIVRAWWRQVRRFDFRIDRVQFAALALLFTAAQTSGDLFDARGLFLLVSLSCPMVLVHRPQRAGRAARSAVTRPLATRPPRVSARAGVHTN